MSGKDFIFMVIAFVCGVLSVAVPAILAVIMWFGGMSDIDHVFRWFGGPFVFIPVAFGVPAYLAFRAYNLKLPQRVYMTVYSHIKALTGFKTALDRSNTNN